MAAEQLNGVIQHLRRAMLRDGAGRSDGQLVKDYLGGRDEAALAALVLRHGPMVWGVCRRILSNYHDAEDAFQATFLVLVRRAASIASPELVANWLYGVAHQTALKARATVHKRKGREKQVADMPETAVVDPSLWHDLQPLLDQELSRLPEIARVVLVLCDLQGKTRKEAAEHLGLPEGTIASRLARARVMLAKRLAQRGVALSAGALAAVLLQNAASAGVPDAVMVSAIRAASLFAAGQTTAAGAASLKVAALAEGVLKAMMINKLKAVVAVLLVLGFAVTGTTILTRRAATAQSATPAPRTAVAQDTKSILEGSKAGDRKELVSGIAFRWCPPGKFKMGEGDDTVDVELSKGFWLGETEVTQGQWTKLMGTSPWSGRTGVGARASTDTTPPKEGPDYAASYIIYDDAMSFCEKLTTQEQDAGRLPKGWNYSLPNEAQWEYACRAGTKTKFSFGDDASQLSQYAWFGDHSGKEPYARQVGLKKPNAWGLCDMHGNVWEWCNDWYASKRSGGKDPVGPTTPPPVGAAPPPGIPPPSDGTSGRNRVGRGGSWIDPSLGCSSANRFYCNPRFGNSVQGFRIAAVRAGQDDNKPMAEKPVEPAAKQESEKEAFTAWGKEVGSLQAGLRYRPGQKRPYSHGETVKLVVRVRNVGKEEVRFQYVSQFLIEIPPAVTDGKGRLVPAGLRSLFGVHLPKQVNLAPGKEIELYGELEVRPDFGTGKVSVQYGRVFGNSSSGQIKLDPALSRLATGKLELEVKSDLPAAKNTFPVGWGGGGGDHYEISVDRTVRHGGKASGSIESIVMEPHWYGALTQAFKADKYRGQRLRMTAFVKCKDVENSAGLWMVIEGFDGKENDSVSKDLMRTPVKGTTDWKQLEVVLDVPKEGSAHIRFGAMLAGKGRVWVDDFKFEAVGNDVKTTGGRVETGKASAGIRRVERLPAEPKNLDFEQLSPEPEIKPDPPDAATEKPMPPDTNPPKPGPDLKIEPDAQGMKVTDGGSVQIPLPRVSN